MRSFKSKISNFFRPHPSGPTPLWPWATRRPRPLSRNPVSATVCGVSTPQWKSRKLVAASSEAVGLLNIAKLLSRSESVQTKVLCRSYTDWRAGKKSWFVRVRRSRDFDTEVVGNALGNPGDAASPPTCKQPCRRVSRQQQQQQPPSNIPLPAAVTGYVFVSPAGTSTALHNYPPFANSPFKPPANCYW